MIQAVTILGRGPSWKECPFRTTELWGAVESLVTPGMEDKPYTKLFAFDGIEAEQIKESLEMAKARNIPIVSSGNYATELFPVWEMVRKFNTSYVKTTMSWMLAYALFKEYNQIWLFGIDQGPQWHHQYGKPYVTFWLGMATALKVDVRLGRGSLTWQYRHGADKLPQAFFTEEADRIANHVGEQCELVTA